MKAVEAAFNQEKALVGAFSVITNLRMDLFEALQLPLTFTRSPVSRVAVSSPAQHVGGLQQSWLSLQVMERAAGHITPSGGDTHSNILPTKLLDLQHHYTLLLDIQS